MCRTFTFNRRQWWLIRGFSEILHYISTQLPCLADLENSVQLPVQEVPGSTYWWLCFFIFSKFLDFFHNLYFRVRDIPTKLHCLDELLDDLYSEYFKKNWTREIKYKLNLPEMVYACTWNGQWISDQILRISFDCLYCFLLQLPCFLSIQFIPPDIRSLPPLCHLLIISVY